jgi:outer membrane protein
MFVPVKSVRLGRRIPLTRAPRRWRARLPAVLYIFGCLLVSCVDRCKAETLRDALELAYRSNPTLNAQRANVSATNENLNRATSGFKPKVSATADVGIYRDTTKPSLADCSQPFVGDTLTSTSCDPFNTRTTPRGAGLQINQNVFDGFRTTNSVIQAKSQILGAQAAARNAEQNTLLLATTAYVDVLTDTAILGATRQHVSALQDQLRQTQARHTFGDVTKTDVAQIESRLAAAKAQSSLAEANLSGDIAAYQRVIGTAPHQLTAAREIERLVPPSLEETVETSLSHNPAIQAARLGVDVALLQTKIIRGELLPSVSLNGSILRRYDISSSGDERLAGSIVGQVSIPLYDGGEIAARKRQSEHVSVQRHLEADAVRDEIRALAERSWSQYRGAKERKVSNQQQMKAAATALSGLKSEWLFGERTLREVLDAQQEAVNARINLVIAQRDLIVSSFTIAQATGRLTLQELDKIDLAARQDNIFNIAEKNTRIALWPRARKQSVAQELHSDCSGTCATFANDWQLKLANQP